MPDFIHSDNLLISRECAFPTRRHLFVSAIQGSRSLQVKVRGRSCLVAAGSERRALESRGRDFRDLTGNPGEFSALRRGTTHLLDSTFSSLLVRGWINAIEGSGPAFARTLPHATSARRGFLRPSARRGGLGLEVPGTATIRC